MTKPIGNIRKRTSNAVFPGSSETGKLQPQAVELEEAVLGAMLIEREALSTVIDLLSPESFYKDANTIIFTAIRELFNRSEPVDILTVTQELKKTGELERVGGAFYISSLTNRVASSANIEFHARIVAQKHLQRELIRIGTNTIRSAYEDSTDVFELLDETTKHIFEIVDSNVRKQHDKMSTLINKALAEIDAAAHQKDGLLGVPSGFTALDRITGGWQKSDLIILAARPGMGKTAFVVTMAKNAAVNFQKPVAIFSLEMSSLQLVKRLISSETEISQDKIIKGNIAGHVLGKLLLSISLKKADSNSIFLFKKTSTLEETFNLLCAALDLDLDGEYKTLNEMFIIFFTNIFIIIPIFKHLTECKCLQNIALKFIIVPLKNFIN